MARTAASRAERPLEELSGELLAHWHELAHLLLSRRLTASLYQRVAGEIPPVQLQALAALGAGDLRMSELAARLGLAVSTVTRLVDRLEAAGLAERRSQRPDRRSVLVGLSAPGSEALLTTRTKLRTLLDELLAELPPNERRELVRLLGKLLGSLRPQAAALSPASA